MVLLGLFFLIFSDTEFDHIVTQWAYNSNFTISETALTQDNTIHYVTVPTKGAYVLLSSNGNTTHTVSLTIFASDGTTSIWIDNTEDTGVYRTIVSPVFLFNANDKIYYRANGNGGAKLRKIGQ